MERLPAPVLDDSGLDAVTTTSVEAVGLGSAAGAGPPDPEGVGSSTSILSFKTPKEMLFKLKYFSLMKINGGQILFTFL